MHSWFSARVIRDVGKAKLTNWDLPWRVHYAETTEALVSYGFGAKHPTVEPVPEPQVIAHHFVWPYDDATMEVSVVIGELTAEKRKEVEGAARDWLKSEAPASTTDIMWRAEPSWESQRNFITSQTEHRFYMRGALWHAERTDA